MEGWADMRILVVDDDIVICDLVEKYIMKYMAVHKPNIEVNIEKLMGVPHLLTYMDKGIRPDAVFMDVKLNKYNGIEMAVKLQELDAGLPVIFITGYIEYAKDIFKANPFHFLVKPIKQEDMNEVMAKLLAYMDKKDKPLIAIKEKDTTYFVNKKDIIYIEAAFNNVLIYTEDKIYKTKEIFRDIELKLEDVLIKSHRSYMVNPSKIKKVDSTQVEMCTGAIVPISRPRKKEFLEQLKETI